MTAYFPLITIVLSLVFSGCATNVKKVPSSPAFVDYGFEPEPSKSFLENCQQLRTNSGFCQNVHLCTNNEGIASICMGLNHQLYLVVRAPNVGTFPKSLPEQFQSLMISVENLRAQMDPDAFILRSENSDTIRCFRIPVTASEDFAVNLLSLILEKQLKPENIGYQWD